MMPLTRSSLLWTTVASLLAVSALWGMGGMPIAQAQTRETTIMVDNFFVDHSGELQPGARENLMLTLEAARRCPSDISFAVHNPTTNLDWGRHYIILRTGALKRLVGDQIEFHAHSRRPGTMGLGQDFTGIEVRWALKPDQEKPNLDVIWTPPKGKKVKAGDTITAKLTARDDATAAQTGVAHIHVYSVSGGLVAAPAQYPAPVPLQECGRQNPVRTYEATYTVPDNPPRMVQLRANARDFANNVAWDDANFPTSDWHGTIKKTAKGGGHNHTIDINFEFVVDPDGSINGRARARITTGPDQVPGCTMLWTYSPSEFDIPLSGRRDGENFEIALEPGTTTATFAGCEQSNTFPGFLNPAVYPETKYQISARDGATNTVERTEGTLPWGVIMRATITIHQTTE